MGKRLTLILGGARSGKSSYAQKLAGELSERVLFVATAVALDDEMTARIAAHQADRPAGWRTLEAPREVGAAIQASPGKEEVSRLDCHLRQRAVGAPQQLIGIDRKRHALYLGVVPLCQHI